MLFGKLETCVINAGHTSGYFNPRNGVRQGCCASPLLFVIAAEILALLIRSDDNIQGIQVRDLECKVTQFADDTTCFVASTESLERVLATIDKFAKFSGLQLNPDKSAIIPLGRDNEVPSSFHGIPVVSTTKILGIWFSISTVFQPQNPTPFLSSQFFSIPIFTVFQPQNLTPFLCSQHLFFSLYQIQPTQNHQGQGGNVFSPQGEQVSSSIPLSTLFFLLGTIYVMGHSKGNGEGTL